MYPPSKILGFGLGLLAMTLASPLARAGEALPTESLKKLKAATVFVQMEFKVPGFPKPVAATGSGFLFRTQGDQGYLVVSYYLLGLQALLPEARPTSSEATVVFFSGTPREKIVKAEQVDNDQERHVCILRVSQFDNLPEPIPYDPKLELIETMPIFLLGFPFGKELARDKKNPAITISKGTISSLRNNDRGELEAVQIDGDFNPGMSGAPVVDGKGRLVGIAMGRLAGTRIAMAVPADHLPGLMVGRVTSFRVVTRKVNQGQADVEITASFRDPMEKTKRLAAYYVPAEELKEKPSPGPGGWKALPNARKVELQLINGVHQGAFALQSAKLGEKSYWFQTVLEGKDGSLTYLPPREYSISFGRSLLITQPFTAPVAEAVKKAFPSKVMMKEGVTVTEYGTVLNNCLLSQDGKYLFDLDSHKGKSTLRRWTVPDLMVDRRLELQGRAIWISQSAFGLVVTLYDREEAWTIDPDTLAVKARFHFPKLVRVIAHPSLAVAFAQKANPSEMPDQNHLTTFDVQSGIVGKDYQRRDFAKPGLQPGLGSPAISPDGKHVFALGQNGQIHRYRVDGLFLTHETDGLPIALSPESNIVISSDNRQLCVQFLGGNRGGFKDHPKESGWTFILKPADLTKPIARIGEVKDIRALAFDPQRDRIFVSQLDHPLLILEGQGKKSREIPLGIDAIIGRILVLPGDGRLLLLSHNRFFLVELGSAKQ